MEKDLSILTERQRIAYTMRKQGASYRKIAGCLGVSQTTARRNYVTAEIRFREYEAYHNRQARNCEPVEFPLNRGELELIHIGLQAAAKEMLHNLNGWRVDVDWKRELPYRAQILCRLEHRVQMALYGRIIVNSLLDPGREIISAK